MPTSGNVTFNLTTNQIITEALLLLGVIGPYESVSAQDYSTCLNTLNAMVKSWEAKGVFVFTENEATIFLNVGQAKYQLGGTNPDKASYGAAIETQTTLNTAGGTSLYTVNSTAGMTVGDTIGIVLDTNALYWDTIATIPSTTTLTITGTIPSNSSSGNYVYSYTTPIGRPLEIENVRRRSAGGTDSTLFSSTNDIKIWPMSRDSYFALPNKGVQGQPTQFYVDKQSTYTNLYVWPAPSTPMYRLELTYRRIIQDFTNASDTADFPQEWLMCLIYQLALNVAPKYGKEMKCGQASIQGANIRDLANQYFSDMLDMSKEKASVKLSPKVGSDGLR